MARAGRHAIVFVAAGVIVFAVTALVLLAQGASAGESQRGGALPKAGTVQFGEDLGGVRVGMSADEVTERWGADFGVCRNCRNETRYYTYAAFEPEGAGVELIDGAVVALFTLWQPEGWRSGGGLALGTSRSEIPDVYLELTRVECAGYEGYVHERRESKTVLYLHDDELWAYALMDLGHPVCR